ncbi:Zinc finger, C2H2 [Phaffia rhodozyma]|uniref:Zinc finger, C2H2 n=1 Tax=Phaffia rhodozyma TaxID=264483 RepID=A0A0F7SJM1_PHARH|nr:Zinc finger, C2H2 [Phaffia rhodozyma]
MSGWGDTSFHQCRWGFCRLSFLTLGSLEKHVEDHLKRSESVDRDALEVTFRDGWYRGEGKKSVGLESLIEQLGHHKKPRLSDFTQQTSSYHADSSTSGSAPAAIIVTSTSSFLHSSSRPHPAGSPSSQRQSQSQLQSQSQPRTSTTSPDMNVSPSKLRSQSRRYLSQKSGDLDLSKSSQDASFSSVPSRGSQSQAAVRRPSTGELSAESRTQQPGAKVRHTTPHVKSLTGSAGGPSSLSKGKSRASTLEVKSFSQAELPNKKSRKKKIASGSPCGATTGAGRPSTHLTQTPTTTKSKKKATTNSDEDILDLLVMDTPSPVSRPVTLPELDVKHEEGGDDVQILTGSPWGFRSVQSTRSAQEDIVSSDQATALVADSADKRTTQDSLLSPKEDTEMVDFTSTPSDASRPSGSTSVSVIPSGLTQPIEQDRQDSQNDPDVSLESDLGIQTQVDVQAVMNFHGIPIPDHLFEMGHDSLHAEEENE